MAIDVIEHPQNSDDSILENVKAFLGLKGVDAFDPQITPLINSALNTLNQNGAGRMLDVVDATQSWNDFRNPLQVTTYDMTNSCKTFVSLKVKQLFDPPAPNTAGYVQSNIDELLWRIREAYNTPEILRTNNMEGVAYDPRHERF